MTLILIPFTASLAQVPVYSEDFENGTAGWVPVDLTEIPPMWHQAAYEGRGVAWCGDDDPSWATPPGYGNNWGQNLTKSFTLPAGNPELRFFIQFDTEPGYDFWYAHISNDGGATWTELFQASGVMVDFYTYVADLTPWAGQEVAIRFRFTSDIGWSDEDGIRDSNGACRLDWVRVGDHQDDFETADSLDGWVATSDPGRGGGPFRLTTLNPEDPGLMPENHHWAAFTLLGQHPFQFPWPDPDNQPLRIGVESPVIDIPLTGTDPVWVQFDYWQNLPQYDYVYFDFQVAIPAIEHGGHWNSDYYIWYSAPPATGPRWRTFTRDLTALPIGGFNPDGSFILGSILPPGHTTMQIRMYAVAYVPGSGYHTCAPLFDNVSVLVPGDYGDLAGVVLADCPVADTPLHGVKLDVFAAGTGDHVGTTVTGPDGAFAFELFSGDYTLSLVRPLGYTTETDDYAVTVLPGMTTQQNYDLVCNEIDYAPRSIGYWKHQVATAAGTRGNGNGPKAFDPKGHVPDNDVASVVCDYLDIVADHFNSNAVNQVIVYKPSVTGLCLDNLAVAGDLLNLHGDQDMIARARQQLMALLLNAAAGNCHLTQVISEDGATISQAITFCDNLIDDPAGDHELAKTIADYINNGLMVPAGMIPLDTVQIAYRYPPQVAGLRLGNAPNPFNPFTTISFTLEHAVDYSLFIYDGAGKLVSVTTGSGHEGVNEVVWHGTDSGGKRVGSGVYFYAVEADGYRETSRMVLVK